MLEMGREEEDENPTEGSEVFPDPLGHGLGEDCGGPAGLWMDEERTGQELEN